MKRDTHPPDSPPAGRQHPSGRARGGAPHGNLNAAKHLAYSQRKAREQRDSHRRRAEREALEILRAAGLEHDPTAALVARQMRRLETVASRLESFLEARGFFQRGGDPKPAVRTLIETTDRLLGEARRLLDQLAGRAEAAVPGQTVLQVVFAQTQGVAAEPLSSLADPKPDPEPDRAPAPAVARVEGNPAPPVEEIRW